MRYELSFMPEPFQGYTEFDELAVFDTEQAGLQGEIEQETRFSFAACTDAQKREIQAAFNTALRSVNNAAAVLGTLYGRPDSITPTTRYLLNRHFHTTDRGDVLKIFRTMFRIRQALEEKVKFKCETNCKGGTGGGWCGYAQATQWFGGLGGIHICFDNRLGHCSFSTLIAGNPAANAQAQAAIIIHEAAHRYVGIDDKAYLWERTPPNPRDYTTLTPTQAMDNADSYAWFCMML